MAILGNALAWILWLYILDSFSAGTAGLATLLTPVIGISSAWIQLGEQPGLIEGLGMIAIVGALLLVALRAVWRAFRRSSTGPPGPGLGRRQKKIAVTITKIGMSTAIE